MDNGMMWVDVTNGELLSLIEQQQAEIAALKEVASEIPALRMDIAALKADVARLLDAVPQAAAGTVKEVV